MKKVKDLAIACKSKSAGPFQITFDIMFGDRETFDSVLRSGSLTAHTIARLYGVPVDSVLFTPFAAALSFKATISRRMPSGSVGDTDIYGAQQHAPLLDIQLDI
jgi:hypothetical protein